MSEQNNGGPAFPVPYHPDQQWENPHGMTLRDYFAAKCMQGLLAGILADGSNISEDGEQNVIECAYRYADKMLKAKMLKARSE